MRTTDEREAELLVRWHVLRHKAVVFTSAARFDQDNKWADAEWSLEVDPKLSPITKEDGTIIVATADTIIEIAADKTQKIRPNGRIAVMTNFTKHAMASTEYKELVEARNAVRTAPSKSSDRDMIARFITFKNKSKYDANALHRILDDWQTVTNGKALSAATDDDVAKLIKHQQDERGLRVGRIERVIAELKGAITHDMKKNDDTKFTRNRFNSLTITPKEGETIQFKDAYTDEHLKIIKAHQANFEKEEWLMIVLHLSSGVRPEGLHSIEQDFWEDAEDDKGTMRHTRGFFITKDKDKKDKANLFGPRALPYPQAVLEAKHLDGSPLIPETFQGRLFKDERSLANLLRNINDELARIGVNSVEKRLTLYSGRHRAAQRMAGRVNDEHQKAIRGNARPLAVERKQANPLLMYGRRIYGHKFNMWELKPAIDKIGF